MPGKDVSNTQAEADSLTTRNLSCCNLGLSVQEAAVAAVSGEDVSEAQAEADSLTSGQGARSSNSLSGTQTSGGEESEVARFEASKEKKHSLENGITVFNRCASLSQCMYA